jgi:hypothetical protein
MSSYQVTIKSPYQKAERQSTFLYLLNGFTMTGMGAFSYLLGNTAWIKSVFHRSVLPLGILSIGLLVYGLLLLFAVFFRNKQWLQNAKAAKWIRLFCIVANLKVSILFLLSNWWLAAAIAALLLGAQLFALILQRKIGQPLSTQFATDQIILPASARRRTLAWTEVNRVLLRHGILTIDCVNNVLYQWPIDQMPAFSADELEAFSIAQIELAKPNRSSDW